MNTDASKSDSMLNITAESKLLITSLKHAFKSQDETCFIKDIDKLCAFF